MDGYTFFYLTKEQEVHLIDTRPADFVDFYNERNWLFLDPVVRTAIMTARPLLWNQDVKPLTATQKMIFNKGSEAGIRDGFNFQINEEFEKGGLSFYSNVIAKSTSDVFEEEKMSLQIFAQAFYLSYKNYLMMTSPEEIDRQYAKVENPLTAREHEILYLVADGLQNPEISKRLHISTETVKEHITKITRKLNAKNRTHSVAIAMKQKILK